MTDALAAAIAALAALLEQENAALARLDLACAVALLPAKQAAAARLADLQQAAPNADSAALDRLQALAEDNRRLLERGIAVQGELIGVIAGALPKAAGPPGYAASGASVRNGPTVAFALSARV